MLLVRVNAIGKCPVISPTRISGFRHAEGPARPGRSAMLAHPAGPPARSLAERERGLAAISAAPGSTALRRVSLKLGARSDRHVRRMARGAALAARALGEEILDDAVFERMEGHRDQPPAGAQDGFGRRQPGDQLAQLVIDEQPQRLKAARRRMLGVVVAAAEHARDEVGEFQRAVERRVITAADDGAGDRRATCVPRPAEREFPQGRPRRCD